ncbi:unnamed protein product [Miscanthus lutarioriparius]|uniref:Wings apart-like protein C-terminal domain-containing protein n=1 Tax=Miscanthus lutarioriparius TaxID=422564 RepID=A0A811N0V3_9POAL|nr:unnamed protein product [Miscanthus lutarioriparius]
MEVEEYGEMMESMDEVTFALDGLRPGAQKRTRRASLLALLGICASAERRRPPRAHQRRLLSLALSQEHQLGSCLSFLAILAGNGEA